MGEQPKRAVRVELGELVAAFESSPVEASYYLDLETGEVALISGETRDVLRRVYKDLGREDIDVTAEEIEEALARRHVTGWEVDAVLEAHRIECGFGDRYLEMPNDETSDAYSDMEEFIATVSDRRLRNQLERAIGGRGAFRYFGDVLADYPAERERWFAFKDARVRERVLDWLAEEGIEPIIAAPSETN